MPASVPGIHHVTCITGDVQRNVDFYVTVLGLRFIKKTVNFDVPDTYHLYFADLVGTPGTAMTFFGWPHLPWKPPGRGQVTAVSFGVPEPSLAFWTARLRQLGLDAERTTRFDSDALVLKDPDGIQLELVGAASDERWVAWPEGPVAAEHAIRGFYSVTLCVGDDAPTAELLSTTMGFKQLGRQDGRTRFQTGAGGAGALGD